MSSSHKNGIQHAVQLLSEAIVACRARGGDAFEQGYRFGLFVSAEFLLETIDGLMLDVANVEELRAATKTLL